MNYALTCEGDFTGNEPSVVRVGEKGYRWEDGNTGDKKGGKRKKERVGSGERGSQSGVMGRNRKQITNIRKTGTRQSAKSVRWQETTNNGAGTSIKGYGRQEVWSSLKLVPHQ